MVRKYAYLFVIMFTFSCQRAAELPKKVAVGVSVFPVYDIVTHLIGDDVNVVYTVPVGANPHTYEPVPSEVRRFRDITLFIGIHPVFDGWMEDYLSPGCRVHYLLDEGEGKHSEMHHHGPGHDHDHHHHEVNPHVWLSVRDMNEHTESIVEILSEALPEQKTAVEERNRAYVEALNRLDRELEELFSDIGSNVFIQWHPAWDGLAEDYGLDIVGTVEHGHGDMPSVRDFTRLVETARRRDVRVIVIGLNVESKAVESLSHETGAQVLRLDTIGDPGNEDRDTYLELMRYNGRRLAEALR